MHKSTLPSQGKFEAETGHFELHLIRNKTNYPFTLYLCNRTIGITYSPETQIWR